jgi:diguanylate cyclase (GGDEF)-like protein
VTKILVIEDDSTIREDIIEVLNCANFEAIGAEDGLIGIQQAKKHKPDLIICDVMMPRLDGYGVLATLRRDPEVAIVPFMFLTAKSSKADLRQGMKLGAVDYLVKPIGQAELLEAVNTQIDKWVTIKSYYSSTIEETQRKVDYLLYFDPLTELPNRLALREKLDNIIADRAAKHNGIVPIMSIDLDRFKRVNDALGEASGDYLLRSVAERLLSCIEPEHIISRLDADEFAIVLTGTDTKGKASKLASQILRSLSRPFAIEGQEVCVTASIGIATYPQDGDDINALLKNANIAMAHAKQQGGSCYEFYIPNLNIGLSEQIELQADLHHALARNEFQVYYQPQVNLRTGKIVGAEALLRWRHPKHGTISPIKFIPLAEESGDILAIGEWVMTTACQDIKRWQDMLKQRATANCLQLKIAVNLSGRQFQHPSLNTTIVQILEEVDLVPQYLELELTESIIIRDVESSIAKLSALKLLGLQISIDDFGVGYSSFAYLKQLPFDILKIDRCFIRDIDTDIKNQAITSSIIQMAHKMGLKVVAEGVETHTEMEFLIENDCDEIQGYLISPPIPFDQFSRMLAEEHNLH